MSDQEVIELPVTTSVPSPTDSFFYFYNSGSVGVEDEGMALSFLDSRYASQDITLTEIAGWSTTTVEQTFALNSGTRVEFVTPDGLTPILQIGEATKHIAVGPDSGIDSNVVFPEYTFSNVISAGEEVSDASGDYVNIADLSMVINPAVAGPAWFIGMQAQLLIPIESTQAIGAVYGVYGSVENRGTGLIGGMRGLTFSTYNNGDGDINHQYGAAAVAEHNGAGHVGDITGLYVYAGNYGVGTCDDAYGILIEFVEGATRNHAILTTKGDVVFNESSDNTAKFRVEGANDAHLLYVEGPTNRVGINDVTPDAKLDVVQSSTTAAIPVLELEQLDLSEEFVNFVGTVSTGNPIEAVGVKTLTVTHYIRHAVNGTLGYIPFGTIS